MTETFVNSCAGRGRITWAIHGRGDRHPALDGMTRGTGWPLTNPWAVNPVLVPAGVGPEVLPLRSAGSVCAADWTVSVPGWDMPMVIEADAAKSTTTTAVFVKVNEAGAGALRPRR